MAAVKIGVSAASLRLPLRAALEEARRLALAGVELTAAGDVAPAQLSQTGRGALRHLLRTFGLELSALFCPLRHGLGAAENLQPRIEHVQNVMGLCYDLGGRVVIVQAGRVPEKPDEASAGFMREALEALARHGDRVGAALALDTGLESGDTLKAFLDRFDTGSLGVNYDPANLLMNGFEPLGSLRALAGRIVHAHARDARTAAASRSAQEVPLGHGDIEWMSLLAAFEEVGYRSWLSVVRDGGQDPRADIAGGAAFLRRFAGA